MNALDEWKRTRFSAYMVYCSVTEKNNRADLYDFLPLMGDPTAEERDKMKQEEAENKRASMNHIISQLKSEWDNAVLEGKIPAHG